jgi:hypothetical protein
MFFNLGVERTVDILNPAIDTLTESDEIRKIKGCSLPVTININRRTILGIPRMNNKPVLIRIRRIISKSRFCRRGIPYD